MRIPAIQQTLLLKDEMVADDGCLHNLVPEGASDVEFTLVRCNPTEKLYWRIVLLEPPMELLDYLRLDTTKISLTETA